MLPFQTFPPGFYFNSCPIFFTQTMPKNRMRESRVVLDKTRKFSSIYMFARPFKERHLARTLGELLSTHHTNREFTSRSILSLHRRNYSMGRQNEGKRVVGPSITLLRERFKKLRRMKEMREERRKVRYSMWEDVYEDPLALRLASTGKHITHFGAIEDENCISISDGINPISFLKNTDIVDTSLHL